MTEWTGEGFGPLFLRVPKAFWGMPDLAKSFRPGARGAGLLE